MITRRQVGFTLVELMIALVLGVILLGSVMFLFINNKHSFNQDENIARMQEDARYAMEELVRDISMAGFFADLLDPAAITPDTSLVLGTDCGPVAQPDWMYDMIDGAGNATVLTLVDNATGAGANAAHQCIDAAELQPGTDVIGLKKVAGGTTAVPQAGSVYLRTNGTVGLLYMEPPAAPPAVSIPAPFGEWSYTPQIYYVRNFATTPGDGIPTLCRKVLQAGPATMVTECIARGIENLQLEFGIDTNDDGIANVYVASPTLVELQDVVAVRILVLARSGETDLKYTNDKTYTLANAAAFTPNDNFYRRTYSETVGIRNVRNLRRMGL